LTVLEGSDDSNQDPLPPALGEVHAEIFHLYHKSLDFNVKLYFPN
jgi:1-phosphatidylinositol-3-phosphate 5-kinase